MASLVVDAGHCNRCGMCVAECPLLIIRMAEEESLPSWVDGAEAVCINCGHCVAICPVGALELTHIPVEKCDSIAKDLLATPEQLEQFLKSRRSIRSYKQKPVEHEKLAKLIDIARYAPSGHNSQPVHWLVVENRKDVKHLAQMTIDSLRVLPDMNRELAKQIHSEALVAAWDLGIDAITRDAPHLMIAHGRKEAAPMGDGFIALTYLELAAHSIDIGACWAGYVQFGIIVNPALAQSLQLPEGHISFGAMMIGYPQYRFSRIPIRNDPQVVWR